MKKKQKNMKKILNEIERAHREKNAAELRKQRLQRHIKLEKDIKKRYNKVHIHNRQVTTVVKK